MSRHTHVEQRAANKDGGREGIWVPDNMFPFVCVDRLSSAQRYVGGESDTNNGLVLRRPSALRSEINSPQSRRSSRFLNAASAA